MTDREKLIRLIDKADEECKHSKSCESCSGYRKGSMCMNYHIADYLLANGVIVPPCKVGDDVYWIDTETNEINCAENDIKAICYYGENNFKVIVQDENTPEDIGTEWCMLTKEEAEEKLKELGK